MMKHKKSMILLFCISIATSSIHAQQKLILHFDVNKTIIAEDFSNNGKTMEQVIIECLAKTYTGQWDSTLSDEISFTEYVTEHLFPANNAADKNNKELRKKRRMMIHAFFDFLKTINDPRLPHIMHRFNTIKQKLESQPGKIFNSFFNLISYLEKRGLDYSIILRTFGQDLDVVSQEICNHIKLTFEWEGRFEQKKLIVHSSKTHESLILEHPQDILSFFISHGHIKIRDDFGYWNSHQELAPFGKLFPLNSSEPDIKTIFFDDNAFNNIINVQHIPPIHLDYNELVDKGVICAVDTLHAIENDNYFIEQLISTSLI